MSFELMRAHVSIRADSSRAKGDMNRAGMMMEKQARGIAMRLRGIMGAFGIASIGYSIVQMLRKGEEFSQKMNNALAITEGVSADMRREMEKTAFDVARVTKFGASEAAEAYYHLISAGLDAKQSMAAMPQVAKFAQAGNFDLARATQMAASAQNAIGLRAEDAQENLENLTRVTDVLTGANTLSQASTEQFAQALSSKSAAAARFFGISLEETTAVLAAFAARGLRGRDAGTAFNIVLRDLTTKALEHEAAFKDMGVDVYDPLTGELRKMWQIMQDVEEELDGMGDKQRKAALRTLGLQDRSIVFTQTLIGASKEMREYERRLNEMGGMTERVANEQMTPLMRTVAVLGADFVKLGNSITRVLGPPLFALAKTVSTLGRIFAAFTGDAVLTGVALLGVAQAFQVLKYTALAAMKAINVKFITSGWGIFIIILGAVLWFFVQIGKRAMENHNVFRQWHRTMGHLDDAWDSILEGFTTASGKLEVINSLLDAVGIEMEDINASTFSWLQKLDEVALSFGRMKGVWSEGIDVMLADFDVFINQLGDKIFNFYDAVAKGFVASFTGDPGKVFEEAFLDFEPSAATEAALNALEQARHRFAEAIRKRGAADIDKKKKEDDDAGERIGAAFNRTVGIGRYGFLEFGQEIQDALLKGKDKTEHEGKVEGFLERSLKVEEETLETLKDFEPAGALT